MFFPNLKQSRGVNDKKMTLKRKILFRIYSLTFLIILAMSVTYYYLFTKDIRERSHQNVTKTFNLIMDDLSTKTNTIAPKVDGFVQTSLTSPMYTLQMVQTQQEPSEQESPVWYVKKVMTYLHTIASRMSEFGTLVEATEILVYGDQRNLLAAYRHEGEEKTTEVYLPEINKDMVVQIHPDDRWYATLQSIEEIPFRSLPEGLPTVYQDDIPDGQVVRLSTFNNFLTIQFSAPIVERGNVQGVCVIYVAIRQKDVERYARLSGTDVNIFAGSALSVGTLPEYDLLSGEFTTTHQAPQELLVLSDLPQTKLSDIKIRDLSYYQGILIVGNRDALFGAITVLFPRWLEEKQKKNFFLVVAGVTFVFSILAAAEAFGLSTTIVNPISRLMTVMKDVETGNLDVEVPIENNDEIGKLADTFNTMTAQLKKYHEHLEELVEERTTELQQEIAERKRAEEEVLLLKNAIETAKVGVTITDTNRKIIYVNPAEARMHEYTVADLIGKDVRIFSPEEYWQDIDFERLEKHWTRESVNVRKDGATFPVHSVSTPVWNEVGNPVGIITVSEDITERKRAEEELQKAKEAADAANRAKSAFLANMSHDIRTPMNAILGFSEILKEQLHDTPKYQGYLDQIISGGHTLLRLIDDILDLSKIEAGHLNIWPEAVNLYAVISELHYMFSLKAREKEASFKLTEQSFKELRDENIPEDILKTLKPLENREILVEEEFLDVIKKQIGEEQTVRYKTLILKHAKKELQFDSHIEPDIPPAVLLDGTRLRQILVNLTGNAVKFTQAGSITVSLQNVTKKPAGDTVDLLFEVRDTGIGIPQEDQQRIFDPFQQHTRSFGGTGLGLSITKRLVELMKGTISFESTVNKGSVFKVFFPGISVVTTEEEGSAEKDYEIKDIQFYGATILLVEDVESNRALLRDYLAHRNLRLIEAENGREAIQKLKQLRPDLILMDIHMPVMGGYQATQLIKTDQELQTIPVVALTAYVTKDQREQLQTIYDAYLTKPISKNDLIATLAQFLPYTNPPLEGGQGGIAAGETPTLPGDRILEEMKDYAAQAGTFSQELLDKLHIELVPWHKDVNELMSADDIIDFSEAAIIVGDSFQLPPLKHYGEELLSNIKVFDIAHVKNLLALFPDIVEIIVGDFQE